MIEPLLECRDLAVGHGGRAVAEGIDLAIRPGDYLCIVGANGSGKSTLLRTMLGLLPPVAGSVESGPGLRAGDIGYLPQQSDLQRDFPASVREVVRSGFLGRMGWRPFYSRAERRGARAAMDAMRVGPLARRCYRELSGGQQQRVLLARALCAARSVLFLDEPVAGLDPAAAADLYALLRRLNREKGLAVAMVSHDTDAAVREATHVLHLGGTDPRCDGPDRAARHVRRPLYCGPVADYRPIPDPPVHDHPAQERDHV